MDHQPAIAQALETAPPSLILGLVTRDPRLRERSLERLSMMIAGHLDGQTPPDARQLGLPL